MPLTDNNIYFNIIHFLLFNLYLLHVNLNMFQKIYTIYYDHTVLFNIISTCLNVLTVLQI